MIFCSWAELEVETFPSSNNTMQAYVAGYAEGVITKYLISYQYQNAMEGNISFYTLIIY